MHGSGKESGLIRESEDYHPGSSSARYHQENPNVKPSRFSRKQRTFNRAQPVTPQSKVVDFRNAKRDLFGTPQNAGQKKLSRTPASTTAETAGGVALKSSPAHTRNKGNGGLTVRTEEPAIRRAAPSTFAQQHSKRRSRPPPKRASTPTAATGRLRGMKPRPPAGEKKTKSGSAKRPTYYNPFARHESKKVGLPRPTSRQPTSATSIKAKVAAQASAAADAFAEDAAQGKGRAGKRRAEEIATGLNATGLETNKGGVNAAQNRPGLAPDRVGPLATGAGAATTTAKTASSGTSSWTENSADGKHKIVRDSSLDFGGEAAKIVANAESWIQPILEDDESGAADETGGKVARRKPSLIPVDAKPPLQEGQEGYMVATVATLSKIALMQKAETQHMAAGKETLQANTGNRKKGKAKKSWPTIRHLNVRHPEWYTKPDPPKEDAPAADNRARPPTPPVIQQNPDTYTLIVAETEPETLEDHPDWSARRASVSSLGTASADGKGGKVEGEGEEDEEDNELATFLVQSGFEAGANGYGDVEEGPVDVPQQVRCSVVDNTVHRNYSLVVGEFADVRASVVHVGIPPNAEEARHVAAITEPTYATAGPTRIGSDARPEAEEAETQRNAVAVAASDTTPFATLEPRAAFMPVTGAYEWLTKQPKKGEQMVLHDHLLDMLGQGSSGTEQAPWADLVGFWPSTRNHFEATIERCSLQDEVSHGELRRCFANVNGAVADQDACLLEAHTDMLRMRVQQVIRLRRAQNTNVANILRASVFHTMHSCIPDGRAGHDTTMLSVNELQSVY